MRLRPANNSVSRKGTRLGLQARLLAIAALVLALCLGVVGWILDSAYNRAVIGGLAEELNGVVQALAAVERERPGGLAAASDFGDQRLSRQNSGWYAYVENAAGTVTWRSPSIRVGHAALAEQAPFDKRPAPGEFHFELLHGQDVPRYAAAYTIAADSAGEQTFWVFADEAPYRLRMNESRRRIALVLGIAAALFVLVQFAALRWGLRPVRQMAKRVRSLEAGERADVGEDYPRELSGLARNLNRFIAFEKAGRERYRRAMDDLAHSLKTPLAVVANALRDSRDGEAEVLQEQVERMQTTIAHQLSRAVSASAAQALQTVPVAPVAERIVNALKRVHADRDVRVQPTGAQPSAAALAVRVDERDLMEMLGNLIENACKYSKRRVRISVDRCPLGVAVNVEDDGGGIPPADRQRVLERGARADTATDGQGIGLAVVLEIATAYRGRLRISDSDLGGAAVRLELPA